MTYPIWLHYYTNYTRVQSIAGLDSKIHLKLKTSQMKPVKTQIANLITIFLL